MLIQAQARYRKGLTTLEILLTFSVVASALIVSLPMMIRGSKGYFFSQSRKLDRQFDPKDRSVEQRGSTSESGQGIESEYFTVARAPIYWPYGQGVTQVGGYTFQLELPPQFPMLSEGFPNSMFTTSSGTSSSSYEYCDEIRGACQ